MNDISESRRWLNVAERAELDAALIPALLGIGHALLAIAEKLPSQPVPEVIWR